MPSLKSTKLPTRKFGRQMLRNAGVRIAALSFLLYLLTSSFSLLHAEHTRRWLQTTYEEFLKGTAHGVAVRSDGRLELAPKFTLLADADASYLWSLRLDPSGALYAAGGSPAKVFRFNGSGKPTTVFESADLLAQSIAFDAKGTLYVATSPDGKVYRVSSSGEKTVFFDPKTKYIWDIAFGPEGNLYVATGDKGQVFVVSESGKGEVFYTSDEAHIRVLAFDSHKDLLAGTEPNGRILRIKRVTPKVAAGAEKIAANIEGFVLYETSKREVTSLAVAPDGSIYVAAIGEKQRGLSQSSGAIVTSPQGTTTITTGGVVSSVSGGQQLQNPFSVFPQAISSSIYRLSPDGAPDELWTSRDDVVYSLGFASDGRLLAGTGNNGALLTIDGHGVFAQLAKAGSAQITGIARNAAGKVFLCTANPGKVFSVGPEYEPEGTYESRSFDAQLFSQWGRLDWWGPPPATAGSAKSSATSGEPRLEFFVRSGNTEEPSKEWSRWFGPYSKPGSAVEAPSARFFQWKAVIHDGRPGDGINWVSVAYLPRNVAPVIDAIVLQDPGVRAQGNTIVSVGQSPSVALKMPPTPNTQNIFIAQTTTSTKFDQPPQGFREKGYQSVLWSAHDDNDDDLRYAVYYRGENEHEWKLLKDNLDQKFYSWDTTTLPDGAYFLKITATDAPSNPPAIAQKTERESERFEVDNTPPTIEPVMASPTAPNIDESPSHSNRGVTVFFTARDDSSSIERAQYSVDGGEWTLVAPTSGISDARNEHYEFTLNTLPSGEHTIAVRAYDRFENVGSAKTTIVVPARKP
ncbi:MAG TPA: Ig-like domain-containing protein [Candidatus Acidoferrum sp.]|nr:Ig-like domain-containing protein [Candidatus Acidoferrum sp.]